MADADFDPRLQLRDTLTDLYGTWII